MLFKLNFDPEISAALIAKIERRANGGSLHKALQIMVIEWSALEDARNRPENGLVMTQIRPDDQDLDAEIDAAFDKIGN